MTRSRDAVDARGAATSASVAPQVNVPVRVAAFWLAYAAMFLGLGLVLGLVPPSGRMLAAGSLITGVALALTGLFTRREGLTLAAAGANWTKGSLGRFAVGLAFGGAMVALLVGCSRLTLGPLAFARNGNTDTSVAALMCITYVALAAGEELGFRGYPFHRLRDRYGILTAQIVVALAFAIYHVLQGWPLVNAFVGTAAGSLMFGAAVLASRGLAFPIGVHAAWNLGSWLVGMKDETGYWRMELARQPSYFEAAAVYLTVLGGSMLVMWWWSRLQPPLQDAMMPRP